MLVTREAKTGELSTQQICAHLGVERWVIKRLLTPDGRDGKGVDGKLLGEKDKGPGKPGQAGQWVIKRKVYLDWLGIPAADRKVLGDDGLPILRSFTSVAEEMGIDPSALSTLIDVNGLDYILVVQGRRYLTAGQLAVVRAKREEASGSR